MKSETIMGRSSHSGHPYILHLERLCQLIEMGQVFNVELHPHADMAPEFQGGLLKHVGLVILAGGDVAVEMMDGQSRLFLGLTLANYKRRWRVWTNGTPNITLRHNVAWRT